MGPPGCHLTFLQPEPGFGLKLQEKEKNNGVKPRPQVSIPPQFTGLVRSSRVVFCPAMAATIGRRERLPRSFPLASSKPRAPGSVHSISTATRCRSMNKKASRSFHHPCSPPGPPSAVLTPVYRERDALTPLHARVPCTSRRLRVSCYLLIFSEDLEFLPRSFLT